MFIKIDYCHHELKQHIKPENLELYNLIGSLGQADNFTNLIADKLGCPTPEKLNLFMQTHSEWIKQQLNIE
jgi:hypothetical protein